ncbi:cyclic pyranopterin phosphate synthase [Methanohalophilus levihalophilus]|uniref:GTP 3',8-cyclase MoaA n=1 Tax=Methanohalophilus levihalophilus TaxID=1431282 RepID=UPI001AE7FDB8|nr:GTP 3',8-cyclase MoaA [Methanohalophilus levihalophilus]MBP2030257.1 cyclic pyranopterin phosphate synthase [Methanohalophilus levihalophilus]
MQPIIKLKDSYGRPVTSLRISITERCNLDCIYCHNEGSEGSPNEMTPEEVANIVKVGAEYGVRKVKFSGGEPLVREDFEEILKALPPLKDVSVTTNAIYLRDRAKSLKEAGLDRVNISLDSLDPECYGKITGRSPDLHRKVLEGIDAAVEAGLTPVKLNMVLLKGVNDDQIDDMLEFTRQYDGTVVLQLIQLMDFNDTSGFQVDAESIEKMLEEKANEVRVRKMHRRRKYIIDGAEVEMVRPVDNTEFCASCNRLRVTADGKLKPCLLTNENLVDTKGASIEELRELFKEAVQKRVPYNRRKD